MKKLLFIVSSTVILTILYSLQTTPETLSIGDNAPKQSLKMMDISGKEISLNDVRKDNGLLVIFSCNTCPFVVGGEGSEGWEGRYDEVRRFAELNKVGMVLVNSNEAKREKGDDLESMKNRAKQHGFSDCYYALDSNSELANSFFARTTPHVYLFDKNLKLVYKGTIDNNV